MWTAKHDECLREWAGKFPARSIAASLGKTKNQVHYHIKKLGLDGTLRGENHHASTLTDLQASMIVALNEAGFTPKEIHSVMSLKTRYMTIADICAARTRRHQ